ncbi:MAG: cytochrome c [Myxococcaceae bacterium]|nr:cytochrome c [Myxococcaceae bacterium]
MKHFIALCFFLLAACGQFPELEAAACPDEGTALRYDNFAQPFFSAWCVECHGGQLGHSSRAFNTLELIRASQSRIFANATGPNAPMPPGPDEPSAAERAQLAQWLACGAP